MNIFLAIATTLLVGYTVTLCVANKKIPESLSQSVFFLPKSGTWLWTVVIGFFAFAAMSVVLDKTPEQWQFIAFISCAALAFVAVCPLCRKDGQEEIDKTPLTYRIHMVGAYVAAVGSQLLVAICQPVLLLAWLPFVLYLAFAMRKSHDFRTVKFWAEMECFLIIFLFCAS